MDIYDGAIHLSNNASCFLLRDSLHESLSDVIEQACSPDNMRMKQSNLGLSNTTKGMREFLDAMEFVVPWAELVSLIEP